MSQTVKARIAVCVDPLGNWYAIGWGNLEGNHDREAMRFALDSVEPSAARFWVEVELPLRPVPVVSAVAEPDQ